MKKALKVGKSKKNKTKVNDVATSKKPVTPEALIDQGNLAIANMQLELSVQFFRRALALRPNDTNIMDALADVLLQLGEQEEAFELLQLSTSTAPTENPYKWCYLAQLQTGEDSVSSYRRGIDIMLEQNSQNMGEDSVTHLPRLIAKAYCSIAEIYMTDLCFDDEAEQKCEAAINSAFGIESNSLDAMQTLASFRLSQQKKPDAARIMEEVYSRIANIREKLSARTVIEEIIGAPDSVDVQDIPEPDFCITTAKLLIECSDISPTLTDNAITLIEGLLLEDDENIELWYIMGVACLTKEPADVESARFHLDRAKEMLDELLVQFQASGSTEEFPFADQYCLMEEHLRLLVEKENVLKAAGLLGPSSEATETAAVDGNEMVMEELEEEEEWSSCDDDEDT